MSEPDYKAQRDALLSALKGCQGVLESEANRLANHGHTHWGESNLYAAAVAAREAIRDAEAQG